MENINVFLTVILLVFGVLQIILFFKIWGMTNNTMELNQKIIPQEKYDAIKEAKIMYYKGDFDKAKDILDTAFYQRLIELSENEYLFDSKYPKLEAKLRPIYETMGIDSPDFEKYRNIENV
ncbi:MULTISPECIES: hypothetical protein [unclassified Dysgonomonas]|uniref:hypothetical protein n=1 Tax=unclassified Dysgonomonas TaxID=2630389 RepID=UPI0025C28468|nr:MULTISPECIES: hypothetical protein [unclassified Dysgonomonas]